MKCLNVLALILVLVGALNWGLWGFFQFDFVAWLFHGNTTIASRIVYSIVGLAGVWSLSLLCKCKQLCCSSSSCSTDDEKKGGCCRK
jgi:uncharacterized membrane protein YuzA (DUF378 family)